jgi:hypothetical protein
MKLPIQSPAVERQVSTQGIDAGVDAGVDPAFLDSIVDGLFGLGALVCEAFSGKDREECLRGYNMVANPAKQVLKPLTSWI